MKSTSILQSSVDERTRVLRRALRRELVRQKRGRPTVLQAALIDAAAIVQAKFEVAATDLATSPNDLVRLSGEARRARLDMLASFDAASKPLVNAFDAYVQAHAVKAAP